MKLSAKIVTTRVYLEIARSAINKASCTGVYPLTTTGGIALSKAEETMTRLIEELNKIENAVLDNESDEQ